MNFLIKSRKKNVALSTYLSCHCLFDRIQWKRENDECLFFFHHFIWLILDYNKSFLCLDIMFGIFGDSWKIMKMSVFFSILFYSKFHETNHFILRHIFQHAKCIYMHFDLLLIDLFILFMARSILLNITVTQNNFSCFFVVVVVAMFNSDFVRSFICIAIIFDFRFFGCCCCN